MKTSPTQRSLKYLRALGMQAQVVEKWNSFAKVRIDLFGWIDIVAVDKTQIVGVQTTSYPNGRARLLKAKLCPALLDWHEAGGILMLHEWKKVKGRWTVKATSLSLADLE